MKQEVVGKMKFYEVGGAVRDRLGKIPTNDVDFAVEASSFKEMEKQLKLRGFTVFLSNPEYFTIRARVPPTSSELFSRTKMADFVLCRKDGPTKDGRHPEHVEPGTIYDDLARRDFTINAMAIDTDTNELIDPHGGRNDLKDGVLRFVGNPMDRILEDGLRVIRGYRFMVTKHLLAHKETWLALTSPKAYEMLATVSIDRIREELNKMLKYETPATIKLLGSLPNIAFPAIFRNGGLKLMASQKR